MRTAMFSGLIAVAVCLGPATLHSQGPLSFQDATREAGIDFRHTDGSSGRRYLVESFSGGVALLDYDLDGLLDIYFLNGAPLPDAPPDPAARNALYRNGSRWRFANVSGLAAVDDAGFGLGVCAADYNNDGFVDMYVTNFGPNVLYQNNGDGTFSNVTAQAGVDVPQYVGAGAAFIDIDNDGLLDLYVANYVEYSLDAYEPYVFKGVPAYPSPLRYRPSADVLFRNLGDGTFADISDESGIAKLRGYGMGVVAADYDRDGDQDIFVANDVMANFLLRNDGKGKFAEVAALAGTALDLTGKAQASMGVDAADFDNDGRVDFHVTSYSGEFATLYRNLDGQLFEDATRITGAGDGTFPHVTWGNAFADFDNDSHRDIFIACGHLDDNFHLRGGAAGTAFEVPNVILRNLGNRRFQNVSASSGDGLKVAHSSRGAAVGDLDGSGTLDVVVLNTRQPPTLLRNNTSLGNHWLAVRLIGRESNRSGVGASVTVHLKEASLFDEVRSGRGYQSHFGEWLHFGLGSDAPVQKLVVTWPSGRTAELIDIPQDGTIVLREGVPGFVRRLPAAKSERLTLF